MTTVNENALRDDVKAKYRDVALHPDNSFHFHTGRPLSRQLGYDMAMVNKLPDMAVESFAGVANPFSVGLPLAGEKVVDAGSGAGFDTFLASAYTGNSGKVLGIDMTDEMLDKAKTSARLMNRTNVAFRKGFIESMPVEDGWADIVISNGVFNLCPDKAAIFLEAFRILRPGGRLQFADIANSVEVPESARADINLWTA